MNYSPTTNGFYPASMLANYQAAGTLPDDLIAISDDDYSQLMQAQSTGKIISDDETGYPIATERAAGIDFADHHWLTTPAALQDIRDALLAGMVPGGMWITADGEPVPMALPDLQALWGECVTRGAGIYRRRLEMAAQIAEMDREQLA